MPDMGFGQGQEVEIRGLAGLDTGETRRRDAEGVSVESYRTKRASLRVLASKCEKLMVRSDGSSAHKMKIGSR